MKGIWINLSSVRQLLTYRQDFQEHIDICQPMDQLNNCSSYFQELANHKKYSNHWLFSVNLNWQLTILSNYNRSKGIWLSRKEGTWLIISESFSQRCDSLEIWIKPYKSLRLKKQEYSWCKLVYKFPMQQFVKKLLWSIKRGRMQKYRNIRIKAFIQNTL